MTILGTIDYYDKRLSRILRSVQLTYLEYFLFPFFTWAGLPACAGMIFCLLIWLAAKPESFFILILFISSVLYTFAVTQAWFCDVIQGSIKAILLHILPIVFTLIICIVSYLVDPESSRDILLYIISLIVAVLPTLILKVYCKRVRPISYDDFDLSKRMPYFRRYYSNLRNKEPNSFPSGDVTVSSCLSVSVSMVIGNYWSLFYILVSAWGRIYYGAHHVTDVIVGGIFGSSSAFFVWTFRYTLWYVYVSWITLCLICFFAVNNGCALGCTYCGDEIEDLPFDAAKEEDDEEAKTEVGGGQVP